MSRINKDNYYLDIAETVLLRSTCLRRHYGAVVVQNDEIIGTGYNGSARGEENCCDKGICERERLGCAPGERYELCVSVHAEQNALLSAGRCNTIGATIYITGREYVNYTYANATPCKMCMRVIKNMGISRIVMRIDKCNFCEIFL